MMEKFFRDRICLVAIFYFLTFNIAHGAVVDGNRIMDQAMEENLCALTFDDGPSQYTAELLDKLAEYGIPATFFMLGKNARNFSEIVHRIKNAGHEIGNHSWSHPNLRLMTTDRQAEEIIGTDTLLRSFGVTPLYMRPPYGSFDERTIAVAESLGVSLLLWSLDSRDWKRLPDNYAKVISTRGTVYDDGALRGIFLFHDTHKSTVEDLPRIIENLRAGGCQRFVTVSEYLAGILDPEPAMLMTRRFPAGHEQPKEALAAKKEHPTPQLARCSRPWNDKDAAGTLDLEDAHAAVQVSETGM